MSACTSIKGSPGYRDNTKSKGFQRSTAIKELEPSSVGLDHPVLHPTATGGDVQTVGYSEPKTSTPSWDSMSPANATSSSKSSKANDDVELILGDQKYYRSDVKPSSTGSQRGSGDAGVALNFERASIREVVKVVLGDVMKEN